MEQPTFTYQGRRFLWGYSADRELCGLWETEDPGGPPLRTWPMSEHEHAWQVFRSAEPRAVEYVAPPPDSDGAPASSWGASRNGSEERSSRRARLVPMLSALGVVIAGIEIAVIATAGGSGSQGLPPGQTIATFEQTIKADLGVKNVQSVSCNLPDEWKAGNRFTCHVYGSGGEEIGNVMGTVVKTQRGYAWNANLRWQPDSNAVS